MKKNPKIKKYMFQVILICFNMMLISSVIMIILLYILRALGIVDEGLKVLGPIWPIVLMLISSIILGTIIGIVLSRRLFKQFLQLGDGIRQISVGNFDVHIDEIPNADKDSDLNNLIISFNKMTEQLKETELLSSDFISNVSHEFKTPLMTIEGYVTLLDDDTLDKEERKKYIRIISEATHKLSNLTSNILKISKLDNSEIDLNVKEYNLSEQIREIIIMLEGSWEKKNIEFNLTLPDCMIVNDEELLEQVWSNVIGNAVKFSNNDSKIDIYLSSTIDKVVVTVRDYGIGMSEETLKRLFDKFYQGDISHSSEGNGLGMTLVNKICELCHGTIDVSSKLDEGSTITITFPLVYK